jgi:hypothetical protein
VHSSPCVHHIHLDPSIALLYLLRYSTADPQFVVNIQGKPHHRPRRTLQPTDRNRVLDHTQWLRQEPLGAGEDSQEAVPLPSDSRAAVLRSVGRSVRLGRWGFALNVDKELRGSAVL